MKVLIALLLGVLFGVGLLLSGMTDPAKVLGFLDVSGLWDPSLGLVMAGAIGVALLPFQWAASLSKSWLGDEFSRPDRTRIDVSLLLGSALFGIGWGLSGFCPGPAIVGLGAGYLPAVGFVVAMLVGMFLYRWLIETHRLIQRDAEGI